MSTYGLDEIIHRWERATLTVEQTIGQILLLLEIIEERLRDVEHKLSTPKQSEARPHR